MSTRRALLSGIGIFGASSALADPSVPAHYLMMSNGPGKTPGNAGIAPGTVGHVAMSRGASSDYASVLLPMVPITNPAFGGVADPTIDNTAAITASLAALNYAFIPDGSFGWSGNITLTANQRIIGQSQAAILVALADTLAILVKGSNTVVDNFSISSTRTTSNIDSGFILVGNAASNIDNIWVNRIKFSAANHALDGVELLATPTCDISNCTISNCLVTTIGRMGIEILSNSTGKTTNLWIVNNSINTTGVIVNGMGVSLSGNIYDCDVSNNFLNACPTTCIELVGGLVNTSIHDNRLKGTSTNLVISSNSTQAIGLRIYNNSSDTDAVGNWLLNACPNAIVYGNLIYGALIQLSSDGIWFHDNKIISTAIVGVIVDNHAKCIVENNYIDNSANGSNAATLRCFNTGAINNLLRNNILVKGTGGAYTDNNSGAAANVFFNNLRDTPDGVVDNGFIAPWHLVLGNTASAARVLTFSGASGSAWRAYTIVMNLTGCDSAGNNELYSSHIITVKAKLGSTTAIIHDSSLAEGGVTIAVTFGTDTCTITATPSAGTQVYNWDVCVTNPDAINAVIIT